jgi:hypothetical protein
MRQAWQGRAMLRMDGRGRARRGRHGSPAPSSVQLRAVRFGKAQQAPQSTVWRGNPWCGYARHSRQAMYGNARQAGRGMPTNGPDWHGRHGSQLPGISRYTNAEHDMARQARHSCDCRGMARCAQSRCGRAGMEALVAAGRSISGSARLRAVRQAKQGVASYGLAAMRPAWHCAAGASRCDLARFAAASNGKARRDSTWHGAAGIVWFGPTSSASRGVVRCSPDTCFSARHGVAGAAVQRGRSHARQRLRSAVWQARQCRVRLRCFWFGGIRFANARRRRHGVARTDTASTARPRSARFGRRGVVRRQWQCSARLLAAGVQWLGEAARTFARSRAAGGVWSG